MKGTSQASFISSTTHRRSSSWSQNFQIYFRAFNFASNKITSKLKPKTVYPSKLDPTEEKLSTFEDPCSRRLYHNVEFRGKWVTL